MDTTVLHDPAASRYVIEHDGTRIGLVDYSIRDGIIDLVHTEIDPSARGEGIGGELIRGALDHIRSETDLTVETSCAFATHWVGAHEEYQDLLQR